MKRRKEKTRTRTVRLNAYRAEARPAWINPQITITEECWGEDTKKVVLTIRTPWELAYLQEELQKIKSHWQDVLK